MLYQEIKSVKLHWDMFVGVVQRWRKGDEGVTTLEMVIIAGFLIAAAGTLTILFNTVFNDNKGKIVSPPQGTPSGL